MTQFRKPERSRLQSFFWGKKYPTIVRKQRTQRVPLVCSTKVSALWCASTCLASFYLFIRLCLLSSDGESFPFYLWRHSHYTNSEIQAVQQVFPINVGQDTEVIAHPGFSFSDKNTLDVVLSGLNFEKTIQVPKFWNPPAYGDGGVRQFLGNHGKNLLSREEAAAIGSFQNTRETIFIAIASYRDPECRPTVENIFERAKYPERIRIAIVDQRAEGDSICTEPESPCDDNPDQALCKYKHLIDSVEYLSELMVGPTLARHIGSSRMYRGEYFSMQVDSHVRFVADWDEDIISQWRATNNEMAVISNYLSDIKNGIDPVTHEALQKNRAMMCNADYEWKGDSKQHIKYNIQPTSLPPNEDSPMLNPFWAAGFSFARGHFTVQVPYDQYLPMVFQGEEISMTIRGFTHGYDFYAPARNVAYHIYAIRENRDARKSVSTFMENEVLFPGAKQAAYLRLNGIIGLGEPNVNYNHTEATEYGLGDVRETKIFFKTFGIKSETQEVVDGLCDFVQGRNGFKSMHQQFSPFLRSSGMGINYNWITYEQKPPIYGDTITIDAAETQRLRARLIQGRSP